MEDNPVGQKTVRFSDLSGQLILDDHAPARIVIHEHPELTDSPVEIEALVEEARAIEDAGVPVAIVDLYFPRDEQPRRVVVEAGVFDKLATDKPMDELLATARPARRAPRSAAAPAAREDRVNYGTLEHAGKPHKGKTTDAEKQLVRAHLDEINERLATQNLRTISLTDPDHVERYGLEDLADAQASNHPGRASLAEDQASDAA
jgi:predicted component of type VI protein secretion system